MYRSGGASRTKSGTKKKRSNLKSIPSPRNPFNTSTTCLSIEAPRGCLSFFLPNPLHTNNKPKSAPKKLRSASSSSSSLSNKLQQRSTDTGGVSVSFGKIGLLDNNDSPLLVNKLGFGSDTSKTNTTPPAHLSISPEIQSLTTTSACFGAGHLLSGVTDKRKCRPRGILSVEQEHEDNLRLFKHDSPVANHSFLNNSRVSLIPVPTEASMHWLLSPTVSLPFSSSSSAHGFSSDICANTSTTSGNMSSLLSPCGQLHFEGLLGSTPPSAFKTSSSVAAATSTCKPVMSKEDEPYPCGLLPTQISPSSGGDSLGSHNVICTPQSDSSSDACDFGFSWLNNAKDRQEYRFEFDSMSEVHPTTLSPKMNQTSMWDPADALPLPGFTFQFPHLTTPPNVIHDDQHLHNAQPLGISTAGCTLQSQMRISWREGLVSRIFEMDDLDCCRLFSDEEEEVSSSGNYKFNSHITCQLDRNVVEDPILKSAEFVYEEPETDEKSNVKLPQKYNSCAESISTEGNDLITSEDSDWNLCYKNQLFEE